MISKNDDTAKSVKQLHHCLCFFVLTVKQKVELWAFEMAYVEDNFPAKNNPHIADTFHQKSPGILT